MKNEINQAGFSMVSVLVTLALISIIGISAGQFFINSQKSRKTLSAKLNFQEVNDAILKVVRSIARNPPASGCYTQSSIGQQLAASPFVSLSNQVNQGLTPPQLTILNSSRNTAIAAAATRCQTFQFAADPSNNNDSSMYFCLLFNRDTTNSTENISGSPHAFVEIKAQTVDAHTNQPTSCNNFRDLKQGSMQVYYSLYWSIDTAAGIEYSQRNNYFHVAK